MCFPFLYRQSATIIIGLSWQNILLKNYYTQSYIVLEIHQYIVEFYFHQANSQYFVDHSMNCRQQQEMSVLVWLIFCVNVAHSSKLCITSISNKLQQFTEQGKKQIKSLHFYLNQKFEFKDCILNLLNEYTTIRYIPRPRISEYFSEYSIFVYT